MSLEDKYYKKVRSIKKRDKGLAEQGTTVGKEEAGRQGRIDAAASLSAAQQRATDNDGYARDTSEGIFCPKGCGAFIKGSLNDISKHNEEFHS
jgi:hypothetical protein